MKKSAVTLFAVLTAVSSLSLGATLNSMNKDDMQQAFVNKTFTSIGSVRLDGHSVSNVFTGTMDDQGKMMGKFSRKPDSAPQMDKGTYIIKDDGLLCINWQHWENGKEFCVNGYNTDNAYIMVDNANRFHTVFLKDSMRTVNYSR